MARLGSHQRLQVPAQFRFVFAEPYRAVDANVCVLARRSGLPHARLGLAAGKRHLRRAVDRNRFKRIVRESFRVHQDRLAGLDIVVLARAAAASASRGELRTSIDCQWRQLLRRIES